MHTYSPYVQTLYDQDSPVGRLGRGAHYSVLRAVVWHDPTGRVLPAAAFHDFAVVWDEDHDDRVIGVVEQIYLAGHLSSVYVIGERIGALTVLLAPEIPPLREREIARVIEDHLSQPLGGDHWSSDVLCFDDEALGIVRADHEKVRRFLDHIHELHTLGPKRIAVNPTYERSIEWSTRPGD